MNQSEFETELRRDGYDIFYGGLKAGDVNSEHAHGWDARNGDWWRDHNYSSREGGNVPLRR